MQCGRTQLKSWVGKTPWRRDRLATPVFMGFPGGSDNKGLPALRETGFGPGLGRSPGGGHDNPPRYSCLGNPHGQISLVGYCPWGCKETDTAEQLSTARGSFIPGFKGNLHTVLHSGSINFHSHKEYRRIPFLHIHSNIYCA